MSRFKMQRCIGIFGRFLFRDVQASIVTKYCLTFPGKVNAVRYSSQAANYRKELNGKNLKKDFHINDLLQFIKNGKGFYLKQLSNVFHTIKFEKLDADDALLLLRYCGSIVPDSACAQRDSICQAIFKGLQEANNTNSEILSRYIKTCTENGVLIYSKELLLKCEPYVDTYKLLLENACHFGKIEHALKLLEIMKLKKVPLDSDSIDNLILVHTIDGGLKSAEAVLQTIRSAQILENSSAKMAIFKGLIRRRNIEEFKKAVDIYPLALSEHELLGFIEDLGLNGLESWLSEIRHFYKDTPITRDVQIEIERICIHLVHMKQPISAMNIFKEFVEPYSDTFGSNILKEMLHCNTDISIIISIAKSLKEQQLNPYSLEYLTELALRFRYKEQAWTLLESLEVLRPHYFWPLLIQYSKSDGENGVFSVLKRIKEFKVNLNAETLEWYVFPYCDLYNLKLLMLKLQEMDFTVREILSPLVKVLLRYKKTKKASELCKLYHVDIFGEEILELLAKAWTLNKDSLSVLTILARYYETNKLKDDIVGTFLIHVVQSCNLNDFKEFLNLLQMIAKHRLKITNQSADFLRERCSSYVNSELQKEFHAAIHSLVDLGLNVTDPAVIPHPSNMDLEGLECHLIQLREKNMNTRGVLRRLIQMHANKGNVQRVKELRKVFLEAGYEESPGIKSSIMHSYVLGGCIEEAISLYEELKTFSPEFRLDSFKFIDLVKLLIDNNKFEEGYNILQYELAKCNKTGDSRSIQRNCRELLSACKNGEQVDKVFSILSQSGICQISNALLGPIVRIHLASGDINKAIDTYIELSQKYKCTPLQVELIRAVAKEKNSQQLEMVLRVTEKVHGTAPTQVGLVAALAENGEENALTKVLNNIPSSVEGLLFNRCKRWTEERKIEPLECLANACRRLPQKPINSESIYKAILNIYDLNGDGSGAITFLTNLPEDERSVNLEQELEVLRNKYKINSDVKLPNTV